VTLKLWYLVRLYGGLLLLLWVLLQVSLSSAFGSLGISPEARERALKKQLKEILVPVPAGWTIIRDYPRYQYLQRQLAGVRYIIYNPSGAINYVFGSYATQADHVASCESGHSIFARNGQYLGLFQMGSSERTRYALGRYRTALDQARAAWRYFVASGYRWGPWQCSPY
jgi:hypothetical protein